jgi:hypothetical protein
MGMQVPLPLIIWDAMPEKVSGCTLMGKKREKDNQELQRTNVKKKITLKDIRREW